MKSVERPQLNLLNLVIAYDILHNGVELVEDFDPCIEVGTRPPPVVDLRQDIEQLLNRCIGKLVYELCNHWDLDDG